MCSIYSDMQIKCPLRKAKILKLILLPGTVTSSKMTLFVPAAVVANKCQADTVSSCVCTSLQDPTEICGCTSFPAHSTPSARAALAALSGWVTHLGNFDLFMMPPAGRALAYSISSLAYRAMFHQNTPPAKWSFTSDWTQDHVWHLSNRNFYTSCNQSDFKITSNRSWPKNVTKSGPCTLGVYD